MILVRRIGAAAVIVAVLVSEPVRTVRAVAEAIRVFRADEG